VAGAARIRVSFQVDADGLLSVSAREMGTGIEARIEVKPSYGLGDDEVTRMLREGFEHAQEDMSARALAEQRVEAQRLGEATHAALAADGDLLDPAERAAIDAVLVDLANAAAGEDTPAIKKAIDALGRSTDEFAARRMNRSIQRALAGRSVESL
jgi:molecular chaperone HscA